MRGDSDLPPQLEDTFQYSSLSIFLEGLDGQAGAVISASSQLSFLYIVEGLIVHGLPVFFLRVGHSDSFTI